VILYSLINVLWICRLLISFVFWTLRRLPEHFGSIWWFVGIFIIDLLLVFVPLAIVVSAARFHDWFILFKWWSWLRVEVIIRYIVITSTTVVRMRSDIALALLVNLRETVDVFPDLLLVLILNLRLTNVCQLCLPIDRKARLVSMSIVYAAEYNCHDAAKWEKANNEHLH
jgi:hypothetical protein